MMEESSRAEIDSRVVELVGECWAKHSKPLLLSQLGSRDDGQLAAVAKQQAGGLAAYIRSRLADQIRVIQHDAMPELVGAIPAETEIKEHGGPNALLERTRSEPGGTARFHRALWAAFRRPLDKSKRRYMSHREPIHFEDVPLGEQRVGDFTEVDSSYIVETGDAAQVQEKIEDWLAANSLDLTTFQVAKRRESSSLPANDLLGRLLVALDRDQLSRISMPLDVVDKLRREAL